MRLPSDLRLIRKRYGFTSSNVLTYNNPKTDKTFKAFGIPTAVLHLTPMLHGVCPAAGTCQSTCLHRSGNQRYFTVKFARRKLRSDAFHYEPNSFKRLLVLEIARYISKHPDAKTIAIRLNGTSDVRWEFELVDIDQHLCLYISKMFGIYVPVGTYHILNLIRMMGGTCYDYTKRVDRDFDLCRKLGYKLTMSHGSIHNTLAVAFEHGLNYAAPIDIKRGAELPVGWVDGDLTDWRPGDPKGQTHVIGLRYKRAKGATAAQVAEFCASPNILALA